MARRIVLELKWICNVQNANFKVELRQTVRVEELLDGRILPRSDINHDFWFQRAEPLSEFEKQLEKQFNGGFF